MCPQKEMPCPKGLMDLNLYKRLIDEIYAADPDTEVWAPIMGEVFVYTDRIFDYIDYAKQAGLNKVYINTNFVLFQPDFIDRLERSNLDKLTIGLDAATRETYNKSPAKARLGLRGPRRQPGESQ